MEPVVSIDAVTHRYGKVVALDAISLDIPPGLEGRQGHELLWIGNREFSQHECVEQAAQCRGRANSQRQRDDDDQGESRSPSQAAEGMPNVKA